MAQLQTHQKHFRRDFFISKDSNHDEIKRLGRNLKKHQIEVTLGRCTWRFKVEIINIDLEKLEFNVRLETGKNAYSIGILKGLELKFNRYYLSAKVSAYVKFDTPDRVKVLKRHIENLTFMPVDSEQRFITPTKQELRSMKEVSVKTNSLGREMKVGTLIVAFNTSAKQIYYGKITKMFEGYFEYSIPDGTTKRCYNTDMIYVPENQEEFEFELAMEMLKA